MEWDSALRASALVIKIDGGEDIIPNGTYYCFAHFQVYFAVFPFL